MPKYKQNYVTSEEYFALQQLGLEYEGFVKGLGYAYSVNISIAPPHMRIFDPPRFVPPGMDLFMYGRMQYLDTSREAVARSYNITPDDIMNKITSVNGDGTITINMGNGQHMTLPQNNSSINITINDNAEEATLVVSAKNNLTQEFRETKTKLVDLPVVFGNIGELNQNLRLISSEGNDQPDGDGVGQPGTWESLIPIWGSGRAAVDHFQNGNYWRGLGYSALAISDVFLVKSLVTAAGRGAWKLGAHSWRATRSWLGKNGYAKAGQPVHHWAISQATAKKYGIEAITNQPWNLKTFSNQSIHMRAGHGYNYLGQPGFGTAGQLWYGTPIWPKAVIGSYGGRGVMEIGD